MTMMMMSMVVLVCRVLRSLNSRNLIVLLALESIYLLQEKGTSADPVNVTQCVPQSNYAGASFSCSSSEFMVWTRVAFCGMTQSTASPSGGFCDNPTADTSGGRGDCIADPNGDRRAVVMLCNTFSNCLVTIKQYNDITARCPAANGFPYAYINYECLPRRKSDGVSYIDMVIAMDSGTAPNLSGKMYLLSEKYPYGVTNKNILCQIGVGANTQVTIRVLDIYGRLLDATGACPFTLYLYSGPGGTYREWCVSRNWAIDYSAPTVFAASPSPQKIDVIFTKTYPGVEAEAAIWLLIDAVNAADNSAANITASFGNSFTPQTRPTTTTTATTTTTTSTSTTTTTPTTSTSTTTTTTTPTTTTTTPTTTTTTTTTPTTTKTTTTPTTTTTTTPTSSSSTTTTTTPSTTTSTIVPSTTPTTTTASTTTQSTTANVMQFNGTSLGVWSSTVGEKTTQGNETMASTGQSNSKTSVIIGVVVAAAAVALIVIVVASVAVYCRRKQRRNGKKPLPSSNSVAANNDVVKASVVNGVGSSPPAVHSISGGHHLYEEIHDDTTDSQIVLALPHGLSASPTLGTTTILRSATAKAKAQPRTTTGHVRFAGEADWDPASLAAASDEGFYQGGSNISDDDKMMRQTASIAGDIHPQGINRSKAGIKGKGKDAKAAGGKAMIDSSGVQMNPVYGIRPNDIYMY